MRTAPSWLDSASVTWPMISPRTFTSARAGRLSPAVSVLRVTSEKVVNFCVKIALTSQTPSTITATNVIPRLRCLISSLISRPA